MQFLQAVRRLDGDDLGHAIWVAVAVTVVGIGTRLAWVHILPCRPILCQLLGARPARCVEGAGSMRHVKQPAVALCTWR